MMSAGSRWSRFLNPRRFNIGFLTVLFLVALRVVIGWHFFQEGLAHKHDPHWSSAGFLRQAKGPLAEQFKRWTPGFHQWDQLIAVPLAPEPVAESQPAKVPQPVAVPDEGNPQGTAKDAQAKDAAAKPVAAVTETTPPNEGNPAGSTKAPAAPRAAESPVYGKWYQQIVQDWSKERGDIANYYGFSDEQNKSSEKMLAHYRDELASLLRGDEADIAAYRHELYRNGQMAALPGAEEIPSERARLAKREQNPVGEPGISTGSGATDWRADAEALEQNWEHDVLALRSAEQLKLGPMAEVKSELRKIDTAIVWLLIVGGGLLMIGLFTRLSALALAIVFDGGDCDAAAVDCRYGGNVLSRGGMRGVVGAGHVGRGTMGGIRFFCALRAAAAIPVQANPHRKIVNIKFENRTAKSERNSKVEIPI